MRALQLTVSILLLAAGVRARGADTAPLRLGIAGLTHGHVHGILGRGGSDVVIVGIAERNRELAARYTERYGLDPSIVYDSLDEMIAATRPEAVAGFGPTSDHLAVVEACAPRGIHVMVEKPLAFDAESARAMESLARRHRVHLLTNLETSWYPSVHAMRAVVRDEGAIGEIRKVVVRDGHPGPKEIGVEPEFLDWLTDPVRNGGGALTDFGCYGANLVTWLMGGEAPRSVTAVAQQIKPDVYPRVDDEATIVLTYPRAQAILQASWNWPVGRKDMDVYGKTGYVLVPTRDTLTLRRDEASAEETRRLEPLPPAEGDPFAHFRAIVRGEADDGDDLSSLAVDVMVARILDAARESARTGRTVELGGR